jgi:hypothetical protein
MAMTAPCSSTGCSVGLSIPSTWPSRPPGRVSAPPQATRRLLSSAATSAKQARRERDVMLSTPFQVSVGARAAGP